MGTIVATMALQILDKLLVGGMDPFIMDAKVRTLMDFTGSTRWGWKIVHKFIWKGTSMASTKMAVNRAHDSYLGWEICPNSGFWCNSWDDVALK
jgi:hypothetical protein